MIKKFAETWDEVKETKYKNGYIKEINEDNNNMPSRKRTVKYSENTDPVDGDKNVEVSEEQSVDTTEEQQQPQQEQESEDERYTPADGK